MGTVTGASLPPHKVVRTQASSSACPPSSLWSRAGRPSPHLPQPCRCFLHTAGAWGRAGESQGVASSSPHPRGRGRQQGAATEAARAWPGGVAEGTPGSLHLGRGRAAIRPRASGDLAGRAPRAQCGATPPRALPPVCHLSSEAGGLTGSSRSSPEAWVLLPGAGVNGGRPPTALPRTQAEGALRGQCVGLAKAPGPPSGVREGRLHRHTSPGWGGSGAQAGPRPGSQKQRVTKSQAAA